MGERMFAQICLTWRGEATSQLKILPLMLFHHNIFTKKGGSTTSKDTMMDGPDRGKSTIFANV